MYKPILKTIILFEFLELNLSLNFYNVNNINVTRRKRLLINSSQIGIHRQFQLILIKKSFKPAIILAQTVSKTIKPNSRVQKGNKYIKNNIKKSKNKRNLNCPG